MVNNSINFTPSQKKAFNFAMKGKNLFVTGGGGNGKSFLIKEIIKEFGKQEKKVIFAAPTGIAAMNIGGTTLHRAFGIPIPALGKHIDDISLSKIRDVRGCDVIIIDEISMCRNDVFDYVYKCITKIEKLDNKKIQIIVVGDFYQLPPVVSKEDVAKLKKFGFDESGLCFTTIAWQKFKFTTVVLSEPMRQTDISFINELNKLRIGDISCLSYFNSLPIDDIQNLPKDAIYICPTNIKASEYNKKRLALLNGNTYAYECKTSGIPIKGDNKPNDEVLLLKEGCRVMICVNDVLNNKYSNGSFGEILRCFDNWVRVKLDTGTIVDIGYYTWEIYKYSISGGRLNKTSIASFSQLPVKLAYAITIHKSQGQTYDKAIISPEAFTEGQFYVAVSRVKSSNGLFFTNNIKKEYIKVNKKVLNFYVDFSYEVPLSQINKQKEIEKKQKASKKTKKRSSSSKTTKTTIKKRTPNTSKKSSQKRTTAKKKNPSKITTKTTKRTITRKRGK